MPADIIDSQMMAALGQERILLMDNYGKPFILQIQASLEMNRAQIIINQQLTQNALEASTLAYATANNHDLTAQTLSTLAAKVAFWNKQNPNSPITGASAVAYAPAASATTTTPAPTSTPAPTAAPSS